MLKFKVLYLRKEKGTSKIEVPLFTSSERGTGLRVMNPTL